MDVSIRQAGPEDVDEVRAVLLEAAAWLEREGMTLWKGDELEVATIAGEVGAGLFFVAEVGGEVAGTVRFQLDDALFWPDIAREDSAFVHRIAVRRRYAGGGVSTAILRWAVERTRSAGRRYLRLDTEASRLSLRAVYERFGFRHHSDRQVGPYFVSRYELDV